MAGGAHQQDITQLLFSIKKYFLFTINKNNNTADRSIDPCPWGVSDPAKAFMVLDSRIYLSDYGPSRSFGF